MNTKVIAIDGPPNSWKTTLINDIKQRYWFLNIKVFEETAREVMRDFPWSENNQDMFQDIIYHISLILHSLKMGLNYAKIQ